MSNYRMNLNNGRVIEFASNDFDNVALTEQLNEQSLLFTAVGGSIVSKHAITTIIPTLEGEGIYEYELSLTDGRKEIVLSNELIDVNNSIAFLNNPNTFFIDLGKCVVQKHAFQTLLLLKVNNPEETVIEE